MKCSKCGVEFAGGNFCPSCGQKSGSKNNFPVILILIGAILMYQLFFKGNAGANDSFDNKYRLVVGDDLENYTQEVDINAENNYDYENLYYVDTYPYIDSRSKELIKLYKEALENQDKLVTVEVENGYRKFVAKQFTTSQVYYYGDLKDKKPHGKGVIFDGSTVLYIGEFKNGMLNGYGIDFSTDTGLFHYFSVGYEGEFKNGKYHGEGILYEPLYRDRVKSNYPIYCEMLYAYGDSVEVESDKYIVGNCPCGTFGAIYKGEFKNGDRSGTGTEYERDYSETTSNPTLYARYVGKWRYDEKEGKGILYNPDGTVKYEGKFHNDVPSE